MKKILFTFFIILISTFVKSQNIFGTTTKRYYGSELGNRTYTPTKFESYIKQEVKTNLSLVEKIVLANVTNYAFGFDYLDQSHKKTISDRYLLFAYSAKNKWTVTSYLELLLEDSEKTEFLKSKTMNIPENTQLGALKNKWDSLEYDWYLPFVYEVELNEKKGYFPANASDMRFVNLYCIDKSQIVFKSVYENDLSKEWNNSIQHLKNVNFEYNYTQPTFAAIKYIMTLFESKIFISGFTNQ